MTPRTCACPHPYPVCACADEPALRGRALATRSKFLSSLAGWPGPLGAARPVAGLDPARIRAGIVAPVATLGGAEIWMRSLLEHADRARIQWCGTAVLYSEVDFGVGHELAKRAPLGRGPEHVDRLYRECDVVLLWGVAAEAQRIPPRPRSCRVVLVSHSHGVDCEWTERVFARSEEADVLVGVSPAAVPPIPEPERGRVTIVRNCYEPSRVAPDGSRDALRAAWSVRPGETVAGFLGRFAPEKNAQAMIALAEADPLVRCVLVGWGNDEAALKRLARDRGVADRVVFAGPVEVPGPSLAAFDAFILPSLDESCAIALLEAWAAGVPTIATPVGAAADHPGLSRMVEGEGWRVAGLGSPSTLHPPPSTLGEQFAAALAADRADPAGTAARVERARELVAREYSPERFGRDWTELIVAAASQEARDRVAGEGRRVEGESNPAPPVTRRTPPATRCEPCIRAGSGGSPAPPEAA